MQGHRKESFGHQEKHAEEEVNQEPPSGAELMLIPKNDLRRASRTVWRP
jgi:hypothetical protein